MGSALRDRSRDALKAVMPGGASLFASTLCMVESRLRKPGTGSRENQAPPAAPLARS